MSHRCTGKVAASTLSSAQCSATWQPFSVASCSPPFHCPSLGPVLVDPSSCPLAVSPSQRSWLDSVALLVLLTWQICNSPLFPQELLLNPRILQFSVWYLSHPLWFLFVPCLHAAAMSYIPWVLYTFVSFNLDLCSQTCPPWLTSVSLLEKAQVSQCFVCSDSSKIWLPFLPLLSLTSSPPLDAPSPSASLQSCASLQPVSVSSSLRSTSISVPPLYLFLFPSMAPTPAPSRARCPVPSIRVAVSDTSFALWSQLPLPMLFPAPNSRSSFPDVL